MRSYGEFDYLFKHQLGKATKARNASKTDIQKRRGGKKSLSAIFIPIVANIFLWIYLHSIKRHSQRLLNFD